MDYTKEIKDYIELEREVLSKLDTNAINDALNELKSCLDREGTIYIFQNDFNKGISEWTEKKFRFNCLNDNVATMMAIANDISYDEVFRFQLKGKLKNDDLIIAISGSGNSKNVLNAVEYAKTIGTKIIGLTGYSGGKLKECADISLHVPINSMQITEDVHMIFDHLMMSVFYKTLCNKNHLS